MTEYLRFVELPTPATRKTRVWLVVANRDGARLGNVKWFSRWRQYAFFPVLDAVFNPDCLHAIARKCAEETEHHRTAVRARA